MTGTVPKREKMKISSVALSSWNNETIQTEKKGQKNRGVVLTLFEELADYVDDLVIREKLLAAARGKFPPKISFSDNTLFFKKNGKIISSLTLSPNPLLAAEEVAAFFSSHGEVPPPSEPVEEEEEIVWGKNNKIQELLLSYFVAKERTLRKLSQSEVDQLYRTLHLGLINRAFNKHNIVLAEKRIQTITGLLWHEEKRCYSVDEALMKPLNNRTSTKQKESHISHESLTKDTLPQFGVRLEKHLLYIQRKMEENEKYLTSPLRGYSINLLQGFNAPQEEIESEEEAEENDSDD